MKNKKSYFSKITSYPWLRCIPATLDVHSILHSFHLLMSAILSHFHRGLLHSFKMASYYFIACMDHNLFSPSFLLKWRYKDIVEPGNYVHGTHSYEWNQRFKGSVHLKWQHTPPHWPPKRLHGFKPPVTLLHHGLVFQVQNLCPSSGSQALPNFAVSLHL